MFEVSDRLTAPYASVCYLECTWSDGYSIRASGVLVGVNDVLTALHAVYREGYGWATQIGIMPGADTEPVLALPFGEFTEVASIAARAPNWDTDGDGLLSQAESQHDLAVLGLTLPIGQITGWLEPSTAGASFNGTMAGYPAIGSGLMAEPVFAQASASFGVFSVWAGLGAGASGGPLLVNDNGVEKVAGVLSAGNTANTVSTYAGLFGSGTEAWLIGAMAGNDGLLETGGVDVQGGSSADWLGGSSFADRFTGLSGDDRIEGGAGVDTAVFRGALGEYGLQEDSAGVRTVIDGVTGRDGIDVLVSVERLQFSDVSVAYDVAGTAGQAYRLYQAAFNRAPDIGGLGHQMRAMDEGLSLVDVARNFIESPEFVRTYGELNNSQFVIQLYANVLHRAPDPEGYLFHLGNLDSGVASRAVVLVGFSESNENKLALIGVMQDGMLYT